MKTEDQRWLLAIVNKHWAVWQKCSITKWFCICLGYFLGHLRFSSSSQICVLSLPFLFLCFFSYYPYSFGSSKKNFMQFLLKRGDIASNHFLAVFLVYKFPVFPKCSESKRDVWIHGYITTGPRGFSSPHPAGLLYSLFASLDIDSELPGTLNLYLCFCLSSV